MDIGINEVIGGLVREERIEHKLSQAELAARSGLHINTIHLLESGTNEPKLSTLLFVIKGMNIDIVEFFKRLMDRFYS